MQAVRVNADGGFVVDQCKEYRGIFFDPGEVEAMFQSAVAHVYDVDFQELAALSEKPRRAPRRPVQYISCPDCGTLMNRKNYGARSGVIVDECREHGIWLDSGELLRLLKWVKAGGRIHDERRKAREAEEQERKRQRTAPTPEGGAFDMYADPYDEFEGSPLDGIVRWLSRLLR